MVEYRQGRIVVVVVLEVDRHRFHPKRIGENLIRSRSIGRRHGEIAVSLLSRLGSPVDGIAGGVVDHAGRSQQQSYRGPRSAAEHGLICPELAHCAIRHVGGEEIRVGIVAKGEVREKAGAELHVQVVLVGRKVFSYRVCQACIDGAAVIQRPVTPEARFITQEGVVHIGHDIAGLPGHLPQPHLVNEAVKVPSYRPTEVEAHVAGIHHRGGANRGLDQAVAEQAQRGVVIGARQVGPDTAGNRGRHARFIPGGIADDKFRHRPGAAGRIHQPQRVGMTEEVEGRSRAGDDEHRVPLRRQVDGVDPGLKGHGTEHELQGVRVGISIDGRTVQHPDALSRAEQRGGNIDIGHRRLGSGLRRDGQTPLVPGRVHAAHPIVIGRPVLGTIIRIVGGSGRE